MLQKYAASPFFETTELANEVCRPRPQQMIGFAFLAPGVIQAFFGGQQTLGFTSEWLVRHGFPSSEPSNAVIATCESLTLALAWRDR